MARGSIREYAAAVREPYEAASCGEKGRMLAEFLRVTGHEREAVIQLMSRGAPRAIWRSASAGPRVRFGGGCSAAAGMGGCRPPLR